ncbi:MAG: hypothetical protein KAR19_20135 [Bacteroidales bacterium]|nr:hypothetical protein [Bacteroidales bacterium]
MKHVDLIIKYLSGDMSQDESRSFEKDLASNSLLQEEFEEVSDAFRLIKAQLWKRDEDAFRAKLREVMNKSSGRFESSVRRQRPKWYFILPLAGSLAILMTVYLANRGADRLFSHFFNPGKDPVILAYNQETRGEVETGIFLYNRGYYMESIQKTTKLISQNPDNQLALLYYLLASIEVDQEEDAINTVNAVQVNTDHQLGQSLTWYTSLAMIKLGRREEAAECLHLLIQYPGPYEAKARRLKKMLLK